MNRIGLPSWPARLIPIVSASCAAEPSSLIRLFTSVSASCATTDKSDEESESTSAVVSSGSKIKTSKDNLSEYQISINQ